MLPETTAASAKLSPISWVGLCLALFGMLLVRQVVNLWRRDLVANMIGHFLVDFVGNVLPKLLR